MNDEGFIDELRAYLQRRDSRVQLRVEWPRAARSPIARMVAMSVMVGIFVAGAIVAGFAILGPRSSSTMPANQGTPGTPAERMSAAMAYDPETRQVVMFGGLGDNGSLGDTWIWSGTDWTQRELSPSPLTRFGASMVYDAKLHGLVLFGGVPDQPVGTSEQNNLDATWLWNGIAWRPISTPHTPTSKGLPPIGVQGSMAYDAATGRVLLVTSATGIHFEACSAETWTFDGNDWRLEDPATPLPASVVTIVSESTTGHVVAVVDARAAVAPSGKLSTSCAAGSPAARALPKSTTWRWTGSSWLEISSGTEPEASAIQIASNGTSVGLDPISGASMVVTDNNEEVWSWNGSRWAEVPRFGTAPSPRTDSMQSIDSQGHVVLYGGYNQRANSYDDDTWVWNGLRWQQSIGPAPQTSTASPVFFTPAP